MVTARGLLGTVDGLSFRDRQRWLAEQAHRLSGTPELARLLDELHGRDEFARRIALRLAAIAGDRDHVERCLSTVDTALLPPALSAAVRLGVPAGVLADRLPGLASALRTGLYQEVRRRGATELAEALLPVARSRFGDREAALLLPVCTSETVTALLPELAYAVTGWRRLGQRHPTVYLDHLDAALDATPSSDWEGLLYTTGSGLAVAALVAPDRVLAVLERVVPYTSVPVSVTRTMGALARHDAPRLLRVLLHPRRDGRQAGGRTLWQALLGAGDDDLAALGRTLDGRRLRRFLRAVPPARRAAVYAGALGRRTPVEAGLPLTVLDLLPFAARVEQARSLLRRRALTDDPGPRLAVTARLPWPEVREQLLDATRRATADERAEAYTHLVGGAAASRDPEVFADMLGMLSRLTNEQDPVRGAALSALAEVPPWLFRDADPELVAGLMIDAARAKDGSRHSEQAIRVLAGRLIREGVLTGNPGLVDTGLRGVEAFGRYRVWLFLYGLDQDLPRGGEHRVFEALRPRLESDARQGRFNLALQLADGLGRRAWAMPALQELVRQATKVADDSVVRNAIETWLRPPATRDARLAEIFHADRSTIEIPAVREGIGWRRTDLLDEVFGKPPHGRFLEKGQRYLPPFRDCCYRWLPRQIARYASLLGEVAEVSTAQPWERTVAIRQLASLPGTADRLRAFLEDQDVTIAAAALDGLAATGDPAEVLPEVLAHVDDDRVWGAVYAAARGARLVSPDQLVTALGPALSSRKVTSRKEAVRLLAANHATGAVDVLTAMWAEPGQHRDVRRALVSSAAGLLDDERVWPLLTEAARAEHAVARTVLDLDPRTIAERHRSRYAALVRTVAGADDPDTARHGLAALAAWTRWDASGIELLAAHVTDLASTATWRAALRSLVTVADATPLRTVATRLAALADTTLPGRDLPARQRVLALADAVRAGATASVALCEAAAVLADTLAGSPTLRRTAVELAAAAVPFDGTEGDGAALSRLVALADTPRLAWRAHAALAAALDERVARVPQAHLHELATTLAGRPSTVAGLLALAITGGAGTESGWQDRWRELVGELRRHADEEVRLAALDTFSAGE